MRSNSPAVLLRRLRTAAARLLAVLGGLYILVTVTPLTAWWAQALAGPWNDPGGDVLIVLGADTTNAGIIGLSSYWRAVYGVRAWRAGGFSTVVIAGGKDVASSIRDFVLCQGIPESTVHIESQSSSTRENALFTRELLGQFPGRRVLVTSDFHMYRAVRVFRKAGIAVEPSPYPDVLKRYGSPLQRWPAFLDLVLETEKILWYRLHGWI